MQIKVTLRTRILSYSPWENRPLLSQESPKSVTLVALEKMNGNKADMVTKPCGNGPERREKQD